jgi:hypothetical protein
VVDSFGTNAEFNYHGYRKRIPGGASSWGKLDLDLRQFMTMFRKFINKLFLEVTIARKVLSRPQGIKGSMHNLLNKGLFV